MTRRAPPRGGRPAAAGHGRAMNGMNRQIRLVGIGMIGPVRGCCSSSSTTCRSCKASSLEPQPAQQPRWSSRSSPTKRGDIVTVRRRGPRPLGADQRRVQVAAHLPHRAPCSPASPATSPSPTAKTGAERSFDADLTGSKSPSSCRQQPEGPDRQPGQEPDRHPDGVGQAAAGGGPAARQAQRARSWPSTPRPAPSWPWYSNPSFDPNLLAAHDQTEVRQLAGAERRPGQAAAPGGLPAALLSRVHVQGDHRLGRARPPPRPGHQGVPATSPPSRFPRPTASAAQLRGRGLRRDAARAVPGVLQHRLRGQSGSIWAARRWPAKPRRSGSTRRRPSTCPVAAQAYFPPADSFAQDQPGLAYSAIGQQDVQATPLEMAMVASAIANGGVIMKPHVLKDVTNSNGQVTRTAASSPWLHGHAAPDGADDDPAHDLGRQQRAPGTAAQLPERPGGGQDRHRPDRSEHHPRLVHRLRPGRPNRRWPSPCSSRTSPRATRPRAGPSPPRSPRL